MKSFNLLITLFVVVFFAVVSSARIKKRLGVTSNNVMQNHQTLEICQNEKYLVESWSYSCCEPPRCEVKSFYEKSYGKIKIYCVEFSGRASCY